MDLVIVGLGRMGANMARRLHGAGHHVVACNRSRRQDARDHGRGPRRRRSRPRRRSARLPAPRIVWLMVPAGDATEATMEEFAALLRPGDTIVDGGNANFQDSKRRHALLAERGIHFVDAGISGGVWGLKNGYGTMVGGDREAVEPLEPIFRALAPEGGYIHCGPPGAGPLHEDGPQRHRVRPHAGLRRGLRDPPRVGVPARPRGRGARPGSTARSSARGCSSWPAAPSRQHGADLGDIRGWVADSGEGRWTVQEAIDLDVPAPVITLSLLARFASRQDESYGARVLAALRAAVRRPRRQGALMAGRDGARTAHAATTGARRGRGPAHSARR